MPVIVFLGYAVIQITISNFVYPMLQGHSLSLGGLRVPSSLFPLTVALVIPGTRWIATLLSSPEPDKGAGHR